MAEYDLTQVRLSHPLAASDDSELTMSSRNSSLILTATLSSPFSTTSQNQKNSMRRRLRKHSEHRSICRVKGHL